MSLFLGAGTIVVFILAFFVDDLLWVDGAHLEVRHETSVLKHRASALEVALLDCDSMASDAARWLNHVRIETVDDTLSGTFDVEWLFVLGETEA